MQIIESRPYILSCSQLSGMCVDGDDGAEVPLSAGGCDKGIDAIEIRSRAQ